MTTEEKHFRHQMKRVLIQRSLLFIQKTLSNWIVLILCLGKCTDGNVGFKLRLPTREWTFGSLHLLSHIGSAINQTPFLSQQPQFHIPVRTFQEHLEFLFVAYGFCMKCLTKSNVKTQTNHTSTNSVSQECWDIPKIIKDLYSYCFTVWILLLRVQRKVLYNFKYFCPSSHYHLPPQK